MFHLIKEGSTYSVANIASNGKYVGGNTGFNTKNSAYKNMWAQVLGGIGFKCIIPIEKIVFQDDTTEKPIVMYLLPTLRTVQTSEKPKKKHILKTKHNGSKISK